MFTCCKSNAAVAEPSPYEAKAARELTPTDEEETKAEEEPIPSTEEKLEEPVEEPKEVEVPLEEVEEKSVADDKTEAEQTEAAAEAEAMTKGYNCCGLNTN